MSSILILSGFSLIPLIYTYKKSSIPFFSFSSKDLILSSNSSVTNFLMAYNLFSRSFSSLQQRNLGISLKLCVPIPHNLLITIKGLNIDNTEDLLMTFNISILRGKSFIIILSNLGPKNVLQIISPLVFCKFTSSPCYSKDCFSLIESINYWHFILISGILD